MLKTKKISQSILKGYNKFFQTFESLLSSFLLLGIRFWMANIFFKSGRTKISNMDNTVYLFEYEYDLPIFSPVFAAYLATFFELICPILLFLGLINRIATIPLIFMSLAIQFLVIENIQHFYWIFLLSIILVFGGGKLSLDRMLKIK